jgi:hypothetical protein
MTVAVVDPADAVSVGIGVAGAARRSNRAQTPAIHALASHKLRQPITATRGATIITM